LLGQDDFNRLFPTFRQTNNRQVSFPDFMDEGCKRVIGTVAVILASLHMQSADDLFDTP
jgi:hypothetical protein